MPAVPHMISANPCQCTPASVASARSTISCRVSRDRARWASSPVAAASSSANITQPPTPVNSPHPAHLPASSSRWACIHLAACTAGSSHLASPVVRNSSTKKRGGPPVPHPTPASSSVTPGFSYQYQPSLDRWAVADSQSPTRPAASA